MWDQNKNTVSISNEISRIINFEKQTIYNGVGDEGVKMKKKP